MLEHPSPPSLDARAHAADTARADRRDVLRKLAVGGALVWTAPMISRTAYAAGAMSCANRVIDWNTFGTGTTFSSTTVGGVTLTLKASTFYGGSSALSTNRTIVASPQGGMSTKALRFEQTPHNGGGQVITLTFSQTVYSVSFTITDIDTLDGNWSDRVTFTSPASFTASKPTGSTVVGAGTATGTTTTTGPLRNTNNNSNLPNTSNGGNVTMSFPGPLTTISFQFACSTIDGGSNQLINILPISFCG